MVDVLKLFTAAFDEDTGLYFFKTTGLKLSMTAFQYKKNNYLRHLMIGVR